MQQLRRGGRTRVDRDGGQTEHAVPVRSRKPRDLSRHQPGYENRPGFVKEGQPHETEAAHFEQAGEGLGRTRHAIIANIHLIIRD
jgi:hypothetical protein